MVPLSVLDLAPITRGSNAGQAFRNSLELAQLAEKAGYQRFWLAEHHNLSGVASAATAVVIGHVAAGTSKIRVGAGGIMLPNHSPLVIAEQFGTLETLFPGRIDLGLGRAPGSDPLTQRFLRRDPSSADAFPDDVVELQALLREPEPGQAIRAVPGSGLSIPIWILGSSLFGAQLAALLGLPFAFASHFAPAQLQQALELYRARFKPSAQLERPYVMLGFNVIAADSDEQAQLLATSLQQTFLNLRRGKPGQLEPPDPELAARLTAQERAILAETLSCSAIGGPETVKRELAAFVARTGADELMVTAHVFDHAARLHSFEIAAALARD